MHDDADLRIFSRVEFNYCSRNISRCYTSTYVDDSWVFCAIPYIVLLLKDVRSLLYKIIINLPTLCFKHPTVHIHCRVSMENSNLMHNWIVPYCQSPTFGKSGGSTTYFIIQ